MLGVTEQIGFMSGGVMSPEEIVLSPTNTQSYTRKNIGNGLPAPMYRINGDLIVPSDSMTTINGVIAGNGTTEFTSFMPIDLKIRIQGSFLCQASGSPHTVVIHNSYFVVVIDGVIKNTQYSTPLAHNQNPLHFPGSGMLRQTASWGSGGSSKYDVTVPWDETLTVPIDPGQHSFEFWVVSIAYGNAVQSHEGHAWTRTTLLGGGTITLSA